jgi:hypothetical protein
MNAAPPGCDFAHFVPRRLAFAPPYRMLGALRRKPLAAILFWRDHEDHSRSADSMQFPATARADTKPNGDVLGRCVGGKWPLDGKMLDTDYSKAMTVTGVSNCAWSPDHVFVVCDQSIMEESKPSRDLSVYVFDPETATFHFYGLSPTGDRPRTTDLTISPDGNHWEYSSKTEIKGKPVQFRTINEFRNSDQVDRWSEYSTDGGANWVKMGGGSEKRQK